MSAADMSQSKSWKNNESGRASGANQFSKNFEIELMSRSNVHSRGQSLERNFENNSNNPMADSLE
jgi:hypothetical protein